MSFKPSTTAGASAQEPWRWVMQDANVLQGWQVSEPPFCLLSRRCCLELFGPHTDAGVRELSVASLSLVPTGPRYHASATKRKRSRCSIYKGNIMSIKQGTKKAIQQINPLKLRGGRSCYVRLNLESWKKQWPPGTCDITRACSDSMTTLQGSSEDRWERRIKYD